MNLVAHPNPDVLLAIGNGGMPDPFSPSSLPSPIDANGVGVTYAGDVDCAKCAELSWSVAVALSRFGAFAHLTVRPTASGIPGVALATQYTSHYVAFSLSAASDRPPLLTIGNGIGQWPASTLRHSVLRGLSAQRIAEQLAVPATPQTRAIFGDANWITLAICTHTGGQPAGVCTATASLS